MHIPRVPAAVLAAAIVLLVLGGCQPESSDSGSGWDPAKAQLTEQRLETLTEIARELRDANGAIPVGEEKVMAEIRKRAPEALVDGYGRPFRYETTNEGTATSVKNGFSFISQGANVDNPADDVRRGAIVEQKAGGG